MIQEWFLVGGFGEKDLLRMIQKWTKLPKIPRVIMAATSAGIYKKSENGLDDY